jgi:RNA polymerase sigma-70 factor (ECF subfamily)
MLADQMVSSLFQAYSAQLTRYAASLARDRDQADDLVQEAFIQAAAHKDLLAQLDGHQRRAWLYKVVKNRFIDQVRAHKRRLDLLQKLADRLNSEESTTEYAGEVDLFERVPSRFRSLLVERFVFGMTSEESALRLSVPAATVRSRLRLAIQWLRTHPEEWR